MSELQCFGAGIPALLKHLKTCGACRSDRQRLIDFALEILTSDTPRVHRSGLDTVVIGGRIPTGSVCLPAAISPTFREFVKTRFEPGIMAPLKKTGRASYEYSLRCHILPVLGNFRLSEITCEMIQDGIIQNMLDRGYAVFMAKEARRVAHTVFNHALRVKSFNGVPPTLGTRFPQASRKRTFALSMPQARAVIQAFENPFRTMALLSITASMSRAELCALRWKRVNCSSEPLLCDGEMIPPKSAAVWETFHRGVFGTPRTEQRRRCVTLPEAVASALERLRSTAPFSGADDIVFSTRTGKPFLPSYLHVMIKRVGIGLDLPWLSWSCLRHTYAVLAEQLGVTLSDRQAQMGLAAGWMMERYPSSEIELQRAGSEVIAQQIA